MNGREIESPHRNPKIDFSVTLSKPRTMEASPSILDLTVPSTEIHREPFEASPGFTVDSLHDDIHTGRWDRIELAFRDPVLRNAWNVLDNTLCLAIREDRADKVLWLLECGASVDQATLNYAVRRGRLGILRILLDRSGLECNLSPAIQGGHDEISKYLISRGVSADNLRAGLKEAVKKGSIEWVRRLIDRDAPVDLTTLNFAANTYPRESGRINAAILHRVIEAGLRWDVDVSKCGESALRRAAAHDDERFEILLSAGAPIAWVPGPRTGRRIGANYLVYVGRTHEPDGLAVLSAVTKHGGPTSRVQRLLAMGVKPELWLLDMAAKNGRVEMVRFYLKLFSQDVVLGDGCLRNMTLPLAAGKGHTEVIRLLLEAGIGTPAQKNRAARWADWAEHEEAAELLVAAGGNPRLEDLEGDQLYIEEIEYECSSGDDGKAIYYNSD